MVLSQPGGRKSLSIGSRDEAGTHKANCQAQENSEIKHCVASAENEQQA